MEQVTQIQIKYKQKIIFIIFLSKTEMTKLTQAKKKSTLFPALDVIMKRIKIFFMQEVAGVFFLLLIKYMSNELR